MKIEVGDLVERLEKIKTKMNRDRNIGVIIAKNNKECQIMWNDILQYYRLSSVESLIISRCWKIHKRKCLT